MRAITILQARTSSTRLPDKALLPLAGYPTAVLAALRAGNLGDELLVATSDESSDDSLTSELRNSGVRVVRGPLQDVLGRYYLAASGLDDSCTIIRLTGDNVFPDGAFVRELAQAFANSGADYISQSSPQSGLPYGLGGEAFSVRTLRQAHRAATDPYDREHVGPWMRRNCRSALHVPHSLGGQDFSYLRCTLDDQEDYDRLSDLFRTIEDPVGIGWMELMQRLASRPGEPTFRVPYRMLSGRIQSELVLGTAQLGSQYGIVNRTGQPTEHDAVKIVRHAIAHGVTSLDTARAYGCAEAMIGQALTGAWSSRAEVVTKLDPLVSLTHDASNSQLTAAVDESVNRSCAALRTSRISTLLLHRWSHYSQWQGAAWQRLLEWRGRGVIAHLGASVYEPGEALQALEDPAIEHLQIPINVLDRRWKEAGVDKALMRRPDVALHARSVFLQGLLISPAQYWPECGYNARNALQMLESLARQFERECVADLCLAYVRSLPWVTSVVVGCETLSQLEANLAWCCRPKLSALQCEELEQALPSAPDALLNPSQWKLVHG